MLLGKRPVGTVWTHAGNTGNAGNAGNAGKAGRLDLGVLGFCRRHVLHDKGESVCGSARLLQQVEGCCRDFLCPMSTTGKVVFLLIVMVPLTPPPTCLVEEVWQTFCK